MEPEMKIIPVQPRSSFKTASRTTFISNYYPVSLKSEIQNVYLYELKIDTIPDDSSQVIRSLVLQIKRKLKDEIQFLSHSGKSVYGLKKKKIPLDFEAKMPSALEKVSLQVILRKEFPIQQFIEDKKTRSIAMSFLNSELKFAIKNIGMCQIGKIGKFYEKSQLNNIQKDEEKLCLHDAGLNVLRGFRFTLAYLQKGIHLQIDACSRVLQSKSICQALREGVITKDSLVGATIITRYGNYKTYRIEEVMENQSPQSLFYHEKLGRQITYREYFYTCYHIKVTDNRQPLLRVLSKVKKQIKNKKLISTPQYIRLIPELVSLAGMSDEQRSQHQVMKMLAPFTKLHPEKRMQICDDIPRMLNKNQSILSISRKSLQAEGYVLQEPLISFGDKRQKLKNGSIQTKALAKAVPIENWMVSYTVGRNQEQNIREVDQIVENIISASSAYKITYEEPNYLEVKFGARPCEWREKLFEFIEKKKRRPKILFLVLKKNEEKIYGQLKNIFLNEFGIVSQFVRANSFRKNRLSVASKVAIQMNVKSGGVGWSIDTESKSLRSKRSACGAFSTSKGSKGFTISFVGMLNSQSTKVYSNYHLNLKRKEEVPANFFLESFYDWIKKFFKENQKQMPEVLIIYREGLSEGEMTGQVQAEIKELKQCIRDIQRKKPNFQPEILYLVVLKRVNTRFFSMRTGVSNPPPGSVVADDFSQGGCDFYMAPQFVNQGTCTPTYFKIVYNTSSISKEQIIQYSYQQCYNYYNWAGAVKVPACLQYADKLATFAGESVKQELTETKKEINSTFYFL